MSALYWFAAVVGVGMFLFSLAADLFGGADIDHGGLDVDHGADVDHGDGGHHGAEGFRILSIRNATYFLFAFGVGGVLLRWVWDGQRGFLTALLAVVLGLMGGAISSVAFGWVRRTESGQMGGDRGWIGLIGRVTLPLSAAGTGKVLVQRDGRHHELLARPFDARAEAPQDWNTVMVLDMEQGVALVSPHDPMLDSGAMLGIAPESEA